MPDFDVDTDFSVDVFRDGDDVRMYLSSFWKFGSDVGMLGVDWVGVEAMRVSQDVVVVVPVGLVVVPVGLVVVPVGLVVVPVGLVVVPVVVVITYPL